MSEQSAVVAALIPPAGSFWKWVDGGRGIAWLSGETIAFRDEVLAVTRRLTAKGGRGLPVFGAIALLLAATRQGWPGARERFRDHAQRLGAPGGGDSASAAGVTLRAIGHRVARETAELVLGLDRIAALPSELFRSLAAKASLAEVIFESAECTVNADLASAICAELETGADPGTFEPPWPRGANAFRELLDIIEAFKPGLKALDAERLELRLRAGLDALVRSPAETLSPAQRVRRLLGEIGTDPELAELAKLAHDLLAAVAVPRSLRRREELPAGGVSDISNRGQLDRLLPSELAHDDLTLAVRVAVNEALYIQRESPPREPPHHRVLLVDTGIRTWGVPRVYITAVALALAATGDVHGELSVFRPAGDKLMPIDLTTRSGLIAHLESLDAHPHFAAALPALADASKAAAPTEQILITHEDVLEDREFRTALRAGESFTGFAAAIARDGTFRLWAMTPAGRKLVRQAKLDLTELLEGRKHPAPPRRPTPPLNDNTTDLPAILRIPPFPLLLPSTSDIRRVIRSGKAKLAITRDRRVLHRDETALAPRQLTDAFPHGRTVTFRSGGGSTAVALVEQMQREVHRYFLCVFDLPHAMRPPIELRSWPWKVRGTAVHDGTLYVIGINVALAYGFGTTEPLASIGISAYRWIRGRIFQRGDQAHVLALTGSRLEFEPVPGATLHAERVFELPWIEGQLRFEDGAIWRMGKSNTLLQPRGKFDLKFAALTAEEDGVIARDQASGNYYVLDSTSDGKWQDIGRSYAQSMNERLRYTFQYFGLRTRFSGIFIDESRNLCLLAARTTQQISLQSGNIHLVPGTTPQAISPRRLRTFVRTRGIPGTGYLLRLASWDDGSKAYLDSRGLLHLKSSDRSIPEITLVLANAGNLAAWTSDGRFYGEKHYHGSDLAWTGQHLMDHLSKFTERLL